ncbi:MAG: MFS transporter [Chloroflexi bacterium RBG_16_57_11]|nr:MAG: MFS transporter [Chloroflexi bacterium RBG_16_57_11]
MKTTSRYRWFVVSVFFAFMLLHQADKLLIGPLTTPIMAEFNINRAQMGFITTGALLVGAVMYPLWGYLYDRYARAKLLALASFLWGATTWLGAIAPTYPTFLVARATTGIDDSSYPGLYSLISDYFLPNVRGKIYGLLELSMPIGYLIGMILGLFLGGSIGWRGVFYITGGLGIIIAAVIFFGVREPPRGQGEPELAELEHISTYRFNWETARGLFQKRTLRILFIQGFFGVFPWNVITYWFFNYLETERGYSQDAVFMTMVLAVLVLATGYPLGGALGDYFFKRTPRGRALVAMTGVLSGAVMLTITLAVPNDNQILFAILLSLTAIFIPMAAPNVVATVYDITLPEVRSTALSVQYFIESSGAALAPGFAGLIADQTSLKSAFLLICVTTWILCGIFFALVARVVPKDVHTLRTQMRQRAEEEKAIAA